MKALEQAGPIRTLVVPSSAGSWDYHDYYVLAAAWSADGRVIHLAGDSGVVFALDVSGALVGRSAMLRSRLPGATARSGKIAATIEAMAVSCAGHVAVGTEDNQIVVFTAGLVRLWGLVRRPTREAILALAWSPDGESLAVACGDGAVRLWRLDQGHERPQWTGRVGSSPVVSLVWDSREEVLHALDQSGALWQLRPRSRVPAVQRPGAFGAGGQLAQGADHALWIASPSGVWRVEGEAEPRRLQETPARALALDRGDRGLVVCGGDEVAVWLTGEPSPVFTQHQRLGYRHVGAALSPDGEWLVLAPAQGSGVLIHVGRYLAGVVAEAPAPALHPSVEAALAAGVQADGHPRAAAPGAEVLERLVGGAWEELLGHLHEQTQRVVIGDDGVLLAWRSNSAPTAVCLRTGHVRWAQPVEGSTTHGLGAWSNGLLFFCSDSAICAVEAGSGRAVWSRAATVWSYDGGAGGALVPGDLLVVCAREDVLALDAATGALRWRWRDAGDASLYAPLAWGGGLVLFTRDQQLVGAEVATGAVRWQQARLGSKHIFIIGALFVVVGYGEARAYRLEDGQGVWGWRADSAVEAAALAGGLLLLLSRSGTLSALEGAAGEVRWSLALPAEGSAQARRGRTDGGGSAVSAALCAIEDGAGGLALASRGRRIVAARLEDGAVVGERWCEEAVSQLWWGGGQLIARTVGGALRWTGQVAPVQAPPVEPAAPGSWRRAEPVEPAHLAAGAALVYAARRRGLEAFGLTSGERRWVSEVAVVALVASAGVVVALETSGLVRARDAAGAVVWTWPRPLQVGFGALAVAGERLVIADGQRVALVALTTGEPRWEVQLANASCSALCLVGEVVLVAVSQGAALLALDGASGAERWRIKPPGLRGVARRVEVADGLIIYSGSDLFVLEASRGEALWSRPGVQLLAAGAGCVWGAEEGAVVAWRLTDGAEVWRWSPGALERVLHGARRGAALEVVFEAGEIVRLEAASGAVLGVEDLGEALVGAVPLEWGWVVSVAGGGLRCQGSGSGDGGLGVVDVEAEIAALGEPGWRRAAARLGRCGAAEAAEQALGTLRLDAREEVRRWAEACGVGEARWGRGVAAAVGARLGALGLVGAVPPELAAPGGEAPEVGDAPEEAVGVALERALVLEHGATQLMASPSGRVLVVMDTWGQASVVDTARAEVIARWRAAPWLKPLAVDEGEVMLGGRGGVERWVFGEAAPRWRRELGSYEHVAWFDGERVWGALGGGLAVWERESGRWLGGRWYGERGYDRPAVVQGRIVMHLRSGEVYALDAQTLRVAWRVEGRRTESSPQAAGAGVVVLGARGLALRDARSGALVWEGAAGELGSLGVGAGVAACLIGASFKPGQRLRAIELSTGAERWIVDAGLGGLQQALVWAGCVVGVGSAGMVARRLADGAPRWLERWRAGSERAVAVVAGRLWAACGDTLRVYRAVEG